MKHALIISLFHFISPDWPWQIISPPSIPYTTPAVSCTKDILKALSCLCEYTRSLNTSIPPLLRFQIISPAPTCQPKSCISPRVFSSPRPSLLNNFLPPPPLPPFQLFL